MWSEASIVNECGESPWVDNSIMIKLKADILEAWFSSTIRINTDDGETAYCQNAGFWIQQYKP